MSSENEPETKIDLFEISEVLPERVQHLISYYVDAIENGGRNRYPICRKFLREVESEGYTFDYGLDGVPMDLQKMEPNSGQPGLSDVLDDLDDESPSPSM